MKITAEPRSDQWNADDFVGGPRTFTVAGVKPGAAEQKYDIELVEGEGRAWRPPLTVLRILIAAWGDDAKVWVGRRVRLYRDPEISFGRDKVGGIRISHVSHIDKPLSLALTATRGKRANHSVQPLPDAPNPADLATEALAAIKAATTEDKVRELGNKAHAQGLLDVQVAGQVLRDHVTTALAAVQQAGETEEPQA